MSDPSAASATHLAQLANNIALTAAALAACAFGVALLQVIMQYASSSAGRSKCSRAAIHSTHKRVKYRWDVLSWKMKIYYPELSFKYTDVVTAGYANQIEGISKTLRLDKEDEPLTGWKSLSSQDLWQRSEIR